MKNQNVLEKIREARKLKGFSQEYVAQELQISPSTYTKIEKEEVKLTVDRLIQIANILQLPVTDLMSSQTERIVNQTNSDASIGLIEYLEHYHAENQVLQTEVIQNLKDEIQYLRSLLNKSLDKNESQAKAETI